MKKLFTMLLILALLSLGGGSALAQEPTAEPTQEPTAEPTQEPTAEPTAEPTTAPTEQPTAEPTTAPTEQPTAEPTTAPTEQPTAEPTTAPTEQPTAEPTTAPTEQPTAEPTEEATVTPTEEATATAEPTEEVVVTPTVEVTGTVELENAGEIGSQALTSIPFTSRVGVMDMSGAGATFSLSYYNQHSQGGGSRGTNSGLTLGAYQMRIVNQATDANITGGTTLKGSGVLQSSNPLAAAVFFGGVGSNNFNQFEAYDSGGFFSPGTKFFIPNGNKKVSTALQVTSELAIQNADAATTAVVDIRFVTQNITKTINVAPNATNYYDLSADASITTGLQQPLVITSRNGQQILVINSNYATKGGINLSDTPGFKPSDAAAVQFLPNVVFRLSNGFSIITFIQNVSSNPVNVTATFVPDPGCTIAACKSGNIIRTASINPNEVKSFNPRTDTSLPAGWFGSVKVSTNDNSASIIAFANQLTASGSSSGTAASGYGARSSSNTATSIFCPYLISGLPNYNASSQASTLLIQNIGNSPTNVTVQFVGGSGSPTSFSTTKPAVTLQSGERLSFNFRSSNASLNGGVPANWFGSARITSNGGKIAAVVNLFNRITSSTSDPLGSYNCISPSN